MKPIVYEIKRTLTSRFVILLMLAIVGLSALLAYESASSSSTTGVPTTPQLAVGYYLVGNNLTMVGYIHDSYGIPTRNIDVFYEYNGTYYHAVSNSNGYANVTFSIDPAQSITVYTNYSYKQFGTKITTSQVGYTVNMNFAYSGLEIFPGIYDRTNASNLGFIAMYVGKNGTSSPPLEFILQEYNSTSQSKGQLIFTQYFNYSNISVIKVFPEINQTNRNLTFFVTAKSSSNQTEMFYLWNLGGKLAPEVGLSKLSVYVPMTQTRLQNLVFSGGSSILGLFIPLLAIFAGYLTYGKDRTSGVLESVLKRPVTRGELITTRFLANTIAIFVAGSLAMLVTDVIYNHYFGMYLTAQFIGQLIWTYLVEGVAFLAVVYLISHVVKSQGALLGAAIALFVVMDLFWSIIPVAVISAMGISSTSSAYVTINILFDYISPAGYSGLVQAFLNGKLGSFGGISINPSAYGITGLTLAIAGILWMLIPFIVAYMLARYRD